MKNLITAGLGMALALSAFTAYAEGDSPHEVSANVAFSTDYMYRGQSQTGNNPSVSGGFDASLPSRQDSFLSSSTSLPARFLAKMPPVL